MWAGSALGAAQIFTRAGIDGDLVALVDEQGHADLGTGLKRSGLQRVGGGVACKARLGLRDDEIGKVRSLDACLLYTSRCV